VSAPEGTRSVVDWPNRGSEAGWLIRLGAELPATPRDGLSLGLTDDIFSAARAKPPRSLWVLSIPGGRLATDSGIAITPDGRAVVETAWDADQLLVSMPRGTRLPAPSRLRGAHASLISLWSANYFHWLLDAIPRYAVLERAGLASASVVVPERLSAFHSESLDLLGISRDRRSRYRREHVQADTLVVPSPAAHTGNPAPWVVDWLRDRLGPRHIERADRLLYVTRAQAQSRRIANEPQLWRELQRRGFERIAPEMLRLSAQIRLFSEARLIVGPHGAAHANTLFASRATLIELFPRDYLNRCNLALSEAAGHDYWYVIGTSSANGSFDVPLDIVEATLDAALERG
jgi:capsular polysaccharide biosynthesis protein